MPSQTTMGIANKLITSDQNDYSRQATSRQLHLVTNSSTASSDNLQAKTSNMHAHAAENSPSPAPSPSSLPVDTEDDTVELPVYCERATTEIGVNHHLYRSANQGRVGSHHPQQYHNHTSGGTTRQQNNHHHHHPNQHQHHYAHQIHHRQRHHLHRSGSTSHHHSLGSTGCSSHHYVRSSSGSKRKRVISLDQRRAANIRERRRMLSLNDAFDLLRRALPTFSYEKKLSRIETLRLALTYMAFMMDVLQGADPKTVRLMPTRPSVLLQQQQQQQGVSSSMGDVYINPRQEHYHHTRKPSLLATNSANTNLHHQQLGQENSNPYGYYA